MKPQVRWWPWLLCSIVVVTFGFYRGWSTFDKVALAIIVCTGLLRVFFGLIVPGWGRQLSQMSPEERAKRLAHLSPEEREKLEKRLRDYAS